MKALIRAAGHLQAQFRKKQRKHRLPPLIFMTDCRKVVNIERAIVQLPKNTIVIVRDYNRDDRKAYAQKIVRLCKKHFLKVLIAGDIALAICLRADGVHIPEHLYQKPFYWKKGSRKWIVTVSMHEKKNLKKTNRLSPDAILFSPVFITSSHPCSSPLGGRHFTKITIKLQKVIYALGGVNHDTVRCLKYSHAAGVAAIEGLVNK